MKVFERLFIVIEGSISSILDRISKLWDILRGLDDSEIIKIMKVMGQFNERYFEKRMKQLNKITLEKAQLKIIFEYEGDNKQKEEVDVSI